MEKFEIVSDIIKKRRTVKPAKMNDRLIPDENIMRLLELADWAPTHKHTEPWRFFVYSHGKAKEFAKQHAELYKSAAGENFQQEKYDKILSNGNNISHIIVCAMKRDTEERIPEIEEIAASSAAIENILIGAAAMELAVYWGSGGMTHKPEFKTMLGLGEKDRVLGILYLGCTDYSHEGKRVTPLEDKIKWIK